MARTNNLTNFLTDVAAAIKEKKGSSATIPAANFDTEILALPSQGVYQTRSVTISANGSQTVTPETGYDAIDEITINVQVPEAQLQTKTYNITQNANLELEPDSGYDGFSSVNVNVNVPTGEDLSTELNEQDQLIEDIKTGLNGKSGSSLNIFAQTEEPDIKKGIWLQTSNEVENIIQDENVFASEQWDTVKTSSLATMPFDYYGGSAAKVGDYVYLFCSMQNTTHNTLAYKYNYKTNKFTQIANTPVSLVGGTAVSYGTDIYIFSGTGSNASTGLMYKYDTINDTYTKLSNPPINGYFGFSVIYNDDIYLFKGTTVAKYNITNNIYNTVNSSNPTYVQSSQYALVGGNIYMFSSGQTSYNVKAIKYSIEQNTFTTLRNVPIIVYGGSAASCGNYIYLFGSMNSSYYSSCYKYDISNNTYTQLANIPTKPYPYGKTVMLDLDNTKYAYLFGATNGTGDQSKNITAFVLTPKTYDKDNAIILSQNPDYKYTTELIESDVINGLQYEFNDVYYYTTQDGLDNTIPTYYGNGTSWVKFKN